MRNAILLLTMLVLAWFAAGPLYMLAKAELAQVLLANAWDKTLSNYAKQKPWYWADTFPVAKLGFSHTGEEYIVLAGGDGRTMAFGPGWLQHTAPPNHHGNTVVTAHNDTHFSGLENIEVGDVVSLEDKMRVKVRYQVQEITVVDELDESFLHATNAMQLTLITCYPFTMGGDRKDKRLVVVADVIASQDEQYSWGASGFIKKKWKI
ncbi:MAG: class GN sortase [Cellvibrionaceae bacterium]